MNRKAEIASIVGATYVTYGKDISPMIIEFWIKALEQFDIENIKNAFVQHMSMPPQGRFCPKPADIVDILKGDSQDRSLIAWSKFDKALRTVGAYQSVIFDDALIHLVISDMGGWCSFETKTEEDWPFIRNEFVNRYKAYSKMTELPVHNQVMIGKTQMENEKNGYRFPEPICLGNPEKIALVYKSGQVEKKDKAMSLGEILKSTGLLKLAEG